MVSNSNATPIGSHKEGDNRYHNGSSYYNHNGSNNDRPSERSGGWDMPRREPAGWGYPPISGQQPSGQGQDRGWPEAGPQSSAYGAPFEQRGNPSSSSGYSAPVQRQSSNEPIADYGPPDGGRGWVSEGRQSSRFSTPVEDRYSIDAQKLQTASNSSSSNAGSGWQTISSAEHEARSAVSRKSSRFQPKALPSHSEVPPLPDLPVARKPVESSQPSPQNIYSISGQQGHPVPQTEVTAVSRSQPALSDWQPQAATALSSQQLSPPVHAQQSSVSPHLEAPRQQKQSQAEAARVVEHTVRSVSHARSAGPPIDEVWVLKDHNAVQNNQWSPTLRSPRVPSGRKSSVHESAGQPWLSSLDSLEDYKQPSELRSQANSVADRGDGDRAQVIAVDGGDNGTEDQTTMSLAAESVRPSESASNMGPSSLATDDVDDNDRSTMRSPSRNMHGPPAYRKSKFRAFDDSNNNSERGSMIGESSPIGSNFDDNPNAMTTGWDPIPPEPLASAKPPKASETRTSPIVGSQLAASPRQAEAKPEAEQHNANGWQAASSISQSGWLHRAAQVPLPAPTPRHNSSHGTVNELERAATPRAAPSTISSASRALNFQPSQNYDQGRYDPRTEAVVTASVAPAAQQMSIKGASKFHSESLDFKDQVDSFSLPLLNGKQG